MAEVAGTVAGAFEAQMREHEEQWLSPLAVRSYETRGRIHDESECRLRTPFQRDRDRILHSKPFRRLKGKTQVFIDPAGDHYRTRMTHTLETTAIARGVARALRIAESLNLTEEVRDGILTHTGEREPATLEGKIVRIVDRVAYINHDIDDSVRFGILAPDDLPQDEVALLGDNGASRIDTLVH